MSRNYQSILVQEPRVYARIVRDAACAGATTSNFFPENGDGEKLIAEKNKHALAVCKGCKVREECLDYAMKYIEYGTWGGMTDKQRRSKKRKDAR